MLYSRCYIARWYTCHIIYIHYIYSIHEIYVLIVIYENIFPNSQYLWTLVYGSWVYQYINTI